jgi:hypothetical protein
MRNDYRLAVVRSVLISLPDLPGELRSPVDRITKKKVNVPGFRNSSKAPVNVRIKPTVQAFEKHPDLVAAILAAWSEKHAGLRKQIYELLVTRGWEVLPVEADRTKLPGFRITWPEGENFEALIEAYKAMFVADQASADQASAEKVPTEEASSDDISLMVVWLSGRLPYHMDGDQDNET